MAGEAKTAERTAAESAQEKPRQLIIVDAPGYVYRAFFALPPMTRPDGTPIQAVYGFSNMILKLMDQYPDDDIVVVFDAAGPTFREEIYAPYKAQREPPPPEMKVQFPLVRRAAEAFDLPVVEVPGYEADDVIATLTRLARERGREVMIVSADKDLMQLVGPGVVMWHPIREQSIGPEEVRERFGVGPEKVRDVLALAGDPTDNVPGVRGIGIKTAAQLVEEFGSLEDILANLDRIRQPRRRQMLAEQADLARLSYELVKLNDHVPLPVSLEDLRRRPPDPKKLLDFFRENAFRSLIVRLEEVAEQAAKEREAAKQREAEKAAARRLGVFDFETLERILADARARGLLALDLETDSLAVDRARIVGLCLATEEGTGFYVPVDHRDAQGNRVNGQLPCDAVLERLRPVLKDPGVLKVGHNIKFDLAILERHGVEVAPVADSMLLSYAANGTAHGHGLDELARRYLDYETLTYAELCGRGAKQISFDRVPVERAIAYGGEDADITLRLHHALWRLVVGEQVVRVYETLDRPLVPIIARMERWGIRVDRKRLHELSRTFGERMAELEKRAWELAGTGFNLGSPRQIGEVLVRELKRIGARRTSTGALSTSADILEELADQGVELARIVLEWRQLQKLQRTYCDALIEQANPKTGRVHTSFNLAATSTGRLSSSDPNLQNIPIRTEEGRLIRAAFVAEDGWVLMSADYSQIELRVLAHLADVAGLKEAFAQGLDVHAAAAAAMFGIPVAQVDYEYRRAAKVINYGIVYGIGPQGLAQRLGVPVEKARAYIETYFERYPEIRAYMERVVEAAREKGYVQTLYGRRCAIADINHRVPSRRNAAERQAINAPVQGTAADIMKRAMIRIDRELARAGLGARMLLQVHDELVFEVPEAEVERTADLVRGLMEQAAPQLTVPLEVELGWGRSWAEAH